MELPLSLITAEQYCSDPNQRLRLPLKRRLSPKTWTTTSMKRDRALEMLLFAVEWDISIQFAIDQNEFNSRWLQSEPRRDFYPPACKTGLILLRRWAPTRTLSLTAYFPTFERTPLHLPISPFSADTI